MTTSATRIHPRSPFSLIQIGQVQIVYRFTAKPAIAHTFYRRPSSKSRFKFMACQTKLEMSPPCVSVLDLVCVCFSLPVFSAFSVGADFLVKLRVQKL